MKHPTTEVDGVEIQNDAHRLADRLERRHNVSRTRVSVGDTPSEPCVWVYVDGGFSFPHFVDGMGFEADYVHSRGVVTFIPKEA